jgi:hypothetical protein
MTWLHREPLNTLERLAHGLAIAGVVAVAITGYRAVSISPLPGAIDGGPAHVAPELGERMAYPLQGALRAVDRDPFHPERRAPMARYLLPEDDRGATVSASGSARGGSIRLLGTAVSGSSGGFAMCQVGGDTPRMLHVGDTLGGLTLRRIDRAAAEFVATDGSVVTLLLPGNAAGAS